MTGSSHLIDNLGLLAHETALLVATAAGLDDESVRAAVDRVERQQGHGREGAAPLGERGLE